MKVIFVLTAAVFLLGASSQVYAASSGAMSGKYDYATKGYNKGTAKSAPTKKQ